MTTARFALFTLAAGLLTAACHQSPSGDDRATQRTPQDETENEANESRDRQPPPEAGPVRAADRSPDVGRSDREERPTRAARRATDARDSDADADPMLDPEYAGTTMQAGAPPRTGVDRTESFDVQLQAGGVGVARQDDRVRLADDLAAPNSDGVIFVEAENAEDVTAKPSFEGELIGRDNAASGGRFVDNPNFMSLPFRVERAGRYDIYIRVRQGETERNNFFWTINSGRHWYRADENDDTPENWWHWRKIDTQRLAADDHRFLYHYRYRASWHFDAIAFVPEGDGAPDGRPGSINTITADRGHVESRDVTPPAVRRLVRIEAMTTEDSGGEVRYEVSLDGGRSWQNVPDGDLRRVNIAGDGSDTMRFRAHLIRDGGRQRPGRSPEFDGLRLTVEPDPDAWRVIRNDFVRVILDNATGRLFRLTDLQHDRELIWPGEPTSMFSIDLKRRGLRTWLRYADDGVQRVRYNTNNNSESAASERGDDAVRFESIESRDDRLTARFRVLEDVAVDLVIALDETGQTIWTAEVANDHDELDVVRLEFPRLSRVRLGTVSAGDRQLRPEVRGYRKWRPGLEPMRDNTYPGAIVLPWQSIHDETGGLGLIARDPAWRNVDFLTEKDGHFDPTFSMSLRMRDNIPAGGGRDRWQTAVAVHPGRWHWVADRYRAFAINHLTRPDYPDWVADSDGFFNFPLQVSGRDFTEFEQVAIEARELGLDHVQMWGQFTGPGGGCCATYWYPSPAYGSAEQFKQGIADMHEHDVRVGFFFLHDRIDLYNAEGSHIHGMNDKDDYPSGTEFPTSEFFDRVQIVTDPAGDQRAYPLSDEQWAEYEQRIEQYERGRGDPPRRNHYVDLSDERWQEYMRRWAIDYYVEQWGADAHYYDVLGTGSARESWDLRKDHHGHAVSGPGIDGIPRTTIEAAQQRGHDDYFLMMEGMTDIPGQYAAGMISALYEGHSETVRYTWPDMILYEGHANIGFRTPLKSLADAWLNGNRFDITQQHSNIMANIVDARARVREWIYRGRFMDTLGLDSPVDARVFRRVDDGARGVAVTFVNPDGEEGRVTLDAEYAPEATHGVAVDDAGRIEIVEITRRDGVITFDAPTGYLTTVVIADHVAPEHAVIGGGRLRRGPRGSAIELSLANLSDQQVTGRLRAVDPGPFELDEADGSVTIDGGAVRVARYDVAADDPAFTTPHHVEFEWTASEQPQTVRVPTFPGARDGDFALRGNNSDEAFRGERSFHLGPSSGSNHRYFPLYLEPGRRYRVSIAYKRTAGSSRINNARVVQRLDPRSETKEARIDFSTTGRWDRSSVIFESADRPSSTSLYVYNTGSQRHLWVDDIRVEDLGPAR